MKGFKLLLAAIPLGSMLMACIPVVALAQSTIKAGTLSIICYSELPDFSPYAKHAYVLLAAAVLSLIVPMALYLWRHARSLAMGPKHQNMMLGISAAISTWTFLTFLFLGWLKTNPSLALMSVLLIIIFISAWLFMIIVPSIDDKKKLIFIDRWTFTIIVLLNLGFYYWAYNNPKLHGVPVTVCAIVFGINAIGLMRVVQLWKKRQVGERLDIFWEKDAIFREGVPIIICLCVWDVLMFYWGQHNYYKTTYADALKSILPASFFIPVLIFNAIYKLPDKRRLNIFRIVFALGAVLIVCMASLSLMNIPFPFLGQPMPERYSTW